MTVKLWDTGVNNEGKTINNFALSKAYANRANWKQVTGTIYDFGINTIIVESDKYFFYFHDNYKQTPTSPDAPYIFPKYRDVAGGVISSHYGAEQYGGCYAPGTPNGLPVRNFRLSGISQIIKITTDEIILIADFGGLGSGTTERFLTKYVFRTVGYTVMPETSLRQYTTLHATGLLYTSINVTPGNDKLFIANRDIPTAGGTGSVNFPPSDMTIFPRSMSINKYKPMYVNTFRSFTEQAPYYTWSTTRGYPTNEQFGVTYMLKSAGDYAGFGIVDNPIETHHHIQPSTIITAGAIYNVAWAAPTPGKYRMTMRVVDSTGQKIYKSVDITNGIFSITSPATGTLTDVIIFLFDRVTNTPTEVITPMDIYTGTTPIPVPPGYVLKFEDHFIAPLTGWDIIWNNPSAFNVANSILNINITSGTTPAWLRKTGFTWKYGILRFRAKFPKQTGVHAAVWGYKNNGVPCANNPAWQSQDSINFETVVSKDTYQERVVGHLTSNFGIWSAERCNQYKLFDTPLDGDAFHDYEMEWTPDAAICRKDGVEIARFTTGIPKQAIDLSLGIDCLGNAGACAGVTWMDHTIQYPINMQIDSIQLYQLEEIKCPTPICNYTMEVV